MYNIFFSSQKVNSPMNKIIGTLGIRATSAAFITDGGRIRSELLDSVRDFTPL